MNEFTQGDIIGPFYFPNESPKKFQTTIRGPHYALVLHDHTQANDTVIVSPLTSLYDEKGIKKKTKSYHLILLKKHYSGLKHDSYVKLDQLYTFSRHKVTGRLLCTLKEDDIAKCHLKLFESLQMQDTIKEIVSKQIDQVAHQILEEYIQLKSDDRT